MSTQSDLFAPMGDSNTPRKWAILRNSQDPYVYYDLFDEQELAPPSATLASKTEPDAAQLRTTLKISKKDFQDGCRRIFRQYVPPAEGPTLRPMYRDFISRNEVRTPEERARLLEALTQYDLSTSGNFKPHFNREKELLTAAKLQQVEVVALRPDDSK